MPETTSNAASGDAPDRPSAHDEDSHWPKPRDSVAPVFKRQQFQRNEMS